MKKIYLCLIVTFICFAVNAQVPNYVPSNGLVGWWGFNGNANDESGNGYNGVVNSQFNTVQYVNGVDSLAIYLTGFGHVGNSGDHVLIPPIGFHNFTSYTISIWVKHVGNTGLGGGHGESYICGRKLSNPCYSTFELGFSGYNPNYQFGYGNGIFGVGPQQYVNDAGNWVMHTFVIDNGIAKGYKNGVLFQTSFGSNQVTAEESIIGIGTHWFCSGGTQSTRFIGAIDNLGIWNRALSACEIQALYSANANANPLSNVTIFPQDTISVCGSNTTLSGPANYAYNWNTTDTTQSINVTQTGWYKCTISNAGCTQTDSVFVSLVNAQIQQNDTAICSGSNLTLSVNPSSTQTFNSCTGVSPFNYNSWTPIAPVNSYQNLIKEGAIYYLRAQNDVYFSNALNGPWNSLNFSAQTGVFNAGQMLGFDWVGQLWVSTYHNSLFAYNNGTWVDKGLGGFGCSGSLLNKLANGRIIVQKSGYLRDLYISDNNGNNWTNVTNVDNDYRDMIVASNGYIYAGGGSGTLSMTGLIRSTDNGSTFTQINSQLGISNAYQFAKDCNNAIYVIADNKIFKTIDGLNWNFICLLPASVTPNYDLFNFVVASNGDYYLSLTNNVFYKSNDQGISWQMMSSVPSINASIMEMKEIDGNVIAITTEGVFAITLSQVIPNTYLWSTGDTTSTINVNPTQSTNYWVQVSNGITTCTDTIHVTVNQPVISINASPNDTLCTGQVLTLSGQGATTYAWSGGVSNGVGFVPASSATYTVTGTDASGCSATKSIAIVVQTAPVVTANANPASICLGNSSTLSATGGASYTWQPGNLTASPMVSPNATTTYTVTATNANGCSNTATKTIVVNSLPAVSAMANPSSICIGASSVLSATGGISYTWQPGGLTGSPSVSPNITTTYTVTAINANGCSNTATQTLVVNSLPIVSASANPSSICIGASSVLSATGGTSYTWQPGGLTGSPSVSPNVTTIYTVTAINANGCSNTATQTIVVNTLPTVSASANPTSICIGASSVLSATGGTSYTWQPGGLTGSPSVSPNVTTTYTVTAINANGCSNTATQTIVVNPLPTVSASANPSSICIGASSVLSATGGISYTWQPGGLTGSPSVSPNTTTIYTVTAINANGCSNTATQTLVVNSLPTVSASANPSSICIGASSVLSATGGTNYVWQPGGLTGSPSVSPTTTSTYTVTAVNANGCSQTSTALVTVINGPSISVSANPASVCLGGSTTLTALGGQNYIWQPGTLGGSPTVSPTVTTTYTVTASNAQGCTNIGTLSVPVNNLPSIAAVANPNNVCAGSTTQLSATGGTTYQWQPGNLVGAPVVNPIVATTYTVVGTDNNGCSNSNTVSIQVSALPTVNATVNPSVICAGGWATLQGTGATSYYWMPGNIFGAPTVFPNVSTTYTVTGTSANGCTATSSATLTVDPPPVITQNPANQTSVNGSTAQFTVQCNNPNATYLWQRDNGLGFQNLSNGGQYSGVNTNTLTISNLTQANNGNWFRCQVSLPGCNVLSTQAILKVDFALGLDQQNTNPSIQIYPNPANTSLNIHCAPEALGSQLLIRDLSGRICYANTLENENTIIPVAAWARGLYMLNVISEKGNWVYRIVLSD